MGCRPSTHAVPFPDNSVYKVPDGLSDEQLPFLADFLPTAYEIGLLNGLVSPGDIVAIVGTGPTPACDHAAAIAIRRSKRLVNRA